MESSQGLRMFRFFIMGALVLVYCSIVAECHWKQHYRYQKAQARPKRQFDSGGGPAQIDLNITVPFIFSARLYPYGEDKGDKSLEPYSKTQAFVTKHELAFLEDNVTVLYVSRDGAVGFGPGLENATPGLFPNAPKMVAVYWAPVSLGDTGRVYYRETEDENVLSLAASEVQIQYHYGTEFKPKSVFIVTWENVAPAGAPNDLPNADRNVYQLALIMSNNGTFAHLIYSKLKWHNNAIAGFNEGPQGHRYFNLPGSGSANAVRLANDSDIGIPGEWLFKIDGSEVHLCGPGFKGLECVNRCERGEFSYDCSRRCHCSGSGICNVVNGVCPTLECSPGWTNAPYCDLDSDECSNAGMCLDDVLQPDCVNTMGSYVCTCLAGYDNASGLCLPTNNGEKLAPAPAPPLDSQTVVIDPAPRVLVPTLVSRGGSAPPIPPQPSTARNGTARPASALPPAPPAPPGPSGPLAVQPKLTVNSPPWAVAAAAIGSKQSHQAKSPVLPVSHTKTYPAIRSTSSTRTVLSTTTTTPPWTADGQTSEAETVEIIPGTLIPYTLSTKPPAPILPPNIPFFTTTTIETPTNGRLPPCDLKCGEHAHCELAQNKPRCVCNKGWSGDGQYCVDVNECFLENVCNGNARCQNTAGSYTCLCEPGFKSDGKQCVDVDECKDGLVQCPGGNTSMCVNTHGSYECRCRPGYNGNPVSVLGCIDINECLIPEFYCGPSAECENFIGSFRCQCHQGYEKNAETNECDDVDECLKAPCSRAAVCHNTGGSFVCTCLDGYTGDGFNCEETILYPFNRVEDQRLPQQKNAVIELPLSRPVKILGKVYDRLYVSANGMISFDEPTRTFSELTLREMRRVALVPLYQRADLTKGGSVYVKETTDYSSLVRGSLNVQEDFHEAGFQAKSIIVVTFEDVMDIAATDDTKRNTFQTVITSGDSGTYVSFIYDRVMNPQGQMGIVAPEPPKSVVAPMSGINATQLKETSNIGIPGKWMFRIDQRQIVQCPSGLLGPPYCLTDCSAGYWGQNCEQVCHCADGVPCDFKTGYCSNHVCIAGFTGDNCYADLDECATRQHRCHYQAYCTNTIGSYECKCNAGYSGDGFNCFEATSCYAAGNVCGPNATCIVSPDGGVNGTSTATCVCDHGFFGDGVTCIPVATDSAASSTPPATNNGTTESFFPPLESPPENASSDTQSIVFEDPLYTRTLNFTSIRQVNQSSTTTAPDQPIETVPALPEPPGTFPISLGALPPPLPPPFIDTVPLTIRPPLIESINPVPDTLVAHSPGAHPPSPSNAVNAEIPTNRSESTSTIPRSSTPVTIASAEGNVDIDNGITDVTAALTEAESTQQTSAVHGDADNSAASTSNSSPTNMLVIIVPAVLCGVWLILIIVLMAVCMRRKKHKQMDKFGLGYYLPAGATSKDSTMTAGTYAAYGSQWTIPRPAYGYYEGAYYPADVYAAYKY